MAATSSSQSSKSSSRSRSRRALFPIRRFRISYSAPQALGLQVLAGHVEITYYVLMVSGFYALWRLIALWRCQRAIRSVLRFGAGGC